MEENKEKKVECLFCRDEKVIEQPPLFEDGDWITVPCPYCNPGGGTQIDMDDDA